MKYSLFNALAIAVFKIKAVIKNAKLSERDSKKIPYNLLINSRMNNLYFIIFICKYQSRNELIKENE